MVQWGGSSYRTEFAYDALSRLRKRTEKFLSGGVWTLIGETRYLYDGMQVVQERDGSNVPTVAYTRGKDLSGSLQGAGGIGGMLARSHGYSAGSWSTHSYYHADGLGNITRLVNSTNGVVASYKYDAYGRTISASGALSGANVYRFSSKMWIYDGTPGYYYFGYRFYQPSLQRWLNRDPIGEAGGINIHCYLRNEPLHHVDPLELCRQPGESFFGCLDRSAKDFYGDFLDLSDDLGYYGLGSAAVGAATDVAASVIDKAAGNAAKDAQIAAAQVEGSMLQKLAAAKDGAAKAVRVGFWRSALAGVSKLSGVIGAAATGFSTGARAAFVGDCMEDCPCN